MVDDGAVFLTTVNGDQVAHVARAFQRENERLEERLREQAGTRLAERAEAGWPPYAHVALLRIEAPESAALEAFWQALEPGRWQAEGVDLLGPVSRPRRAGRERAQLLWRASRRGQLHPLLRQLRATLQDARWARSVRWAFDVDPWTLD